MTDVLPAASIFNAAEHELASFLCAVTSVIGFNALSRACDLWIQIMKSSDWPANENFEKFFRNVTIRAASQLEDSSRAARELGPMNLRVSLTSRVLLGVGKPPQINSMYSTNNQMTFHDEERA